MARGPLGRWHPARKGRARPYGTESPSVSPSLTPLPSQGRGGGSRKVEDLGTKTPPFAGEGRGEGFL